MVDLGFAEELACYGEYSGNPTTELTNEYAKTLLDLMTRTPDPQGRDKFLLVGGGIANFTDVAKTLDVKSGDVLITSDYSSLFPPGIRIGTVASTRLLPGSLFQHVDIAPSVDFTQLEEVFVLLHCPDTARVTLETSGITEH